MEATTLSEEAGWVASLEACHDLGRWFSEPMDPASLVGAMYLHGFRSGDHCLSEKRRMTVLPVVRHHGNLYPLGMRPPVRKRGSTGPNPILFERQYHQDGQEEAYHRWWISSLADLRAFGVPLEIFRPLSKMAVENLVVKSWFLEC